MPEASRQQPTPLISCARLLPEQPLQPGYTAGYCCHNCKAPLQVSPQGIDVLRHRDAVTLCNPCAMDAIKLITHMLKTDPTSTADIILGSDAIRAIEKSTGHPIEQEFPNAESTPLTPAQLLGIGRHRRS